MLCCLSSAEGKQKALICCPEVWESQRSSYPEPHLPLIKSHTKTSRLLQITVRNHRRDTQTHCYSGPAWNSFSCKCTDTISHPSLINQWANAPEQRQWMKMCCCSVEEVITAGVWTVSLWTFSTAVSRRTVIWLRHLLSWCSASLSIVSQYIPHHCDVLSQAPPANKAGRQILSGHAPSLLSFLLNPTV